MRLSSDGPLLLFESTQRTTCRDLETGSVLRGVQTVLFVERVGGFKGAVGVRRLAPLATSADAAVPSLLAFRNEVRGRPYESSVAEMRRSKYRRNRKADLSSLYCCELVAEAYQRMGVVRRPPEGRTSNNYSPGDFGAATEAIDFVSGWSLGSELTLRE
jgi:hypothetical protein